MFKVGRRSLVALSGLIWMAIGIFLFQLGIRLLLQATSSGNDSTILHFFALFGGVKIGAIILVFVSLTVGFFKGKYVLRKTVMRSLARIKQFPETTSIFNLYSKGNLLLILVMMGLGMSMRYFNLPNDLRAFIDLTVGTALLQGGMLYFRSFDLLTQQA